MFTTYIPTVSAGVASGLVGVIDISRYQTYKLRPVWAKIRKAMVLFKGKPLPILGVIVKTTEGDYGWKHPEYLEVMKAADGEGFWTGSYHYLHAQYLAANQAKFFLENIWKGSKHMGLWCDVEEPGDLKYYPVGKRWKIISCAFDFCKRVQAVHGQCDIYTGAWYWDKCEPNLERSPESLGIRLWAADYREANAGPQLPVGWTKYVMWQFTGTGQVDGILGNCDVNSFNGIEANLGDLDYTPVGDAPPVVLSESEKLDRLWRAHPELQ